MRYDGSVRTHAGGDAARFEAILEPGGRIVAIAAHGGWPRDIDWQRLVGGGLLESVAEGERQAMAALLRGGTQGAEVLVDLEVGEARVQVALSSRRVGDRVTLTLLREGKPVKVVVTLAGSTA